MSPSPPRAAARPAGVLLVAVLVATVLAGPAAAHPFGPPSQATVSAAGDTVTVRWSAAEDDWVALGHHLGAFEAVSGGATDPQPQAGATAPPTGEALLAASPALRDYLLGGVAVRQAATDCPARLDPVGALLAEGVTLTFTCPRPVDAVALDLRLLTDLNPAYRTAMTVEGAAPARALLTAEGPVAALDFGAGAATGVRVATGGVTALAVAALLGVGIAALRRRVPAEVTP